MRTTVYLASALMLTGGLGVVGTLSAQNNAELADGQRELQTAREELEAAAREVARLSARATEPVVGGIIRDFQRTGRRAMLGINIEDSGDGVLVAGVSPGGPADDSGVETGDVIVAIDSAELTASEVNSPSEVLIGQMVHVNPGDTVTLSILRDGEQHEIEVGARSFEARYRGGPGARLPPGGFRAGRPMPQPFNFSRPLGRWADMELVELTPALGAYFGTNEGILIVRAPSDDELELEDGDVILEIDGRAPMGTEHAMRILGSFEPGETLELVIMRSQRRETLELELAAGGRRG